jgi:hypothetical protein
MIWIFIILFLLVGLLAWVLFGPIIIFVNTETNRYQLALPGVFRLAVVPSGGLFHIRCRAFFIPWQYNPFKPKKEEGLEKEEKKAKGKAKQPKKPRGLKIRSGSLRMAGDLLRSFRIRKLDLDLDTDDVILNAWLVPAFSMVNCENIRMRVNFEGNASLLLDLRTRLGALLWIFIRNKYKSMFNP